MRGKLSLSFLSIGVFIFLGLTSLGYLLGKSIIEMKKLDRVVSVKGLAEREEVADIVLWPIDFKVAGNELSELYSNLERDNTRIVDFLKENGIDSSEITVSAPIIEDKMLYQYDNNVAAFRYIATQTITVYSTKVNEVYKLTNKIGELIKENIALGNSSNQYGTTTEYIFTKLNELKPQMIESATKNAREVAEKFAKDSNSSLGKIKSANQGQFTITNRDQHNPQIKNIRVVSTVEYYLVD
ncbi:SIMPL domain-containing protein [Cetobacterium sp. 8H]|uniref:SIMPL domain-containing protein n=1 Tax=Cetobacterium sp. 8H TaxID=2759681 RepID=UPI00163B73B4|nr:SIMPL domain-containing protein [Cetobacterium sp. 8H]MBC2851894.1 SIMPL domain-containing protein [Cetobacterium sp. 8H]